MTDQEYLKRLNAVAVLFKEKPRTATDIRKAVKCSKPTAYSLIEALITRGYIFEIAYVRQAKKGPESARYEMVKKGKSLDA